jgi:uncharacterized membrane protein (DUF2068 family)
MAERRDRGLVLIGIFKLIKAALLVCTGVLLLLHLDGDAPRTVAKWAERLRIDPHNTLIHGLIEQLFRLDRKKLEAIGIGTFIYAAVFTIEAIGLLLAKRWAEYVTLAVTISFIPIEIFEIVKDGSAIKAITIVLNVAIVIYLAVRLKSRR